MENQKAPLSFSFGRLICSISAHKFRVSKKITEHIKEYKCTCCGEEMTDTANGFLAKLTPRFRETNAFLAKIHERRTKRIFSEAS